MNILCKILTSDHLPLSGIFNIECISSVKVVHTDSYQTIYVTSFRWPDATEDDIKSYHDLTFSWSHNIILPPVILCSDCHCSSPDHKVQLDALYSNICDMSTSRVNYVYVWK